MKTVKVLSQDDIQRAFDCELLSLLPLLDLTPDDVAWPNAKFTPQPNRGYLRVFLLPAASQQATLGFPCFVRLSGIYQISICRPKNEGLGVGRKWKDVLLSAFFIGHTLAVPPGLTITVDNAYSGATLEEEDRAMTPVTVSYYCYAPQNLAESARHGR